MPPVYVTCMCFVLNYLYKPVALLRQFLSPCTQQPGIWYKFAIMFIPLVWSSVGSLRLLPPWFFSKEAWKRCLLFQAADESAECLLNLMMQLQNKQRQTVSKSRLRALLLRLTYNSSQQWHDPTCSNTHVKLHLWCAVSSHFMLSTMTLYRSAPYGCSVEINYTKYLRHEISPTVNYTTFL